MNDIFPKPGTLRSTNTEKSQTNARKSLSASAARVRASGFRAQASECERWSEV
jgi:hypothetical protein